MDQFSVSVIIPTYNSGRFVTHAIESVLAQSIGGAEIIVVDDGSTDGTAARMHEYRSGVRYHQRAHGGPGAARNYGARVAKGQWLAFLDADDFWYSHKLIDQFTLAAHHPTLDFITGNHHNVDEGGRLMGEAFADNPMASRSTHPAAPEACVFGAESREQYVEHRFGILSTTLVRAELFHRVGGFAEQFAPCEDLHLMFRLVAEARRFGAVQRPVAAYRVRRDSLSHRDDEGRHRMTILAMSDLLRQCCLPSAMARAVRREVAQTQLNLAYLLARQGRRLSATLSAGRAFVTRPSRQALQTAVSVNMPARSTPVEDEIDGFDPVELFEFGVLG
jgi:hypothetical protein